MDYTYTLNQPSPPFFQYQLQRSDSALIPCDFGNTDFQAFLRWLSAGNTLPGLPPGF